MSSASSAGPEVLVRTDAAGVAASAADRFIAMARLAQLEHENFYVALSGGSTPRALYALLAEAPRHNAIDWSRVHIFFSDERFVLPDSTESNFHMARETLLARAPLTERFVHPVATVGVSPEESAALYAEAIRRVVPVKSPDSPRFDLILLGLGPDGHTASLFPDSAALQIRDEIVAPNYVAKFESWRITFTYPLINAAACVLFLVQGADKAQRVAEVMSGADLPATGVQPVDGRLVWLLDAGAAADLPAQPPGS